MIPVVGRKAVNWFMAGNGLQSLKMIAMDRSVASSAPNFVKQKCDRRELNPVREIGNLESYR